MKRRGKASARTTARRRTAAAKARPARPTKRRKPPAADLQIELQKRTRELNDALEQLTATSEVLRLMSGAQSDLARVFETILANATRLGEASFGILTVYEGDGRFRVVAMHNPPPKFAELRRREPVIRPGPMARLVAKQVLHIADITEHPATKQGDPDAVAFVKTTGVRTILGLPMLKADEVIGAIVVYRKEVRPFADRQIELVKNFAAQAVIAIENTRLLNELRRRTTDLTESLEQQTATSEVLRVISSSPGDLLPVFESMLANATRLCEAKFGNLWLREGDKFRIVAIHGGSPEYRDYQFAEPLATPDPESAMGRIARERKAVQIDDISKAPTHGMRARIATIKIAKARTLVGVPMLKDNEVIGIIGIYRQEVRPFTGKQIELLTNFAAQAVIAIENTRLLNELRESLQQQTATAEVLGVISSSPSDLGPVFQTMLANATRLCDASFGLLLLYEGNWLFRGVAMHNAPPAFAELRWREPVFEAGPQTGLGRAVATKGVVHIADYLQEAVYKERHPAAVALGDLGAARTFLVVPMLKEEEVVGAIAIYRQQVRPFGDKQIALVANFAAQAVIAIENTRLLNELRHRTADLTESLEQQTATSEVLRVISSSPGELEPVFQAMLENATRICDAKFGLLLRYDREGFRLAAEVGTPPALSEFLRQRGAFRPVPGTHLERIMRTRQVSHTPDYASDGVLSPAVELGGARSTVDVPLLKNDELIGAFSIYRQEVRPFTDKQIELVRNFAAQAVIAIENARLLNELRQRTDDLTESLEQQTATSNVLDVISRSAFDLNAVFEAVAESSVRLCGADRGAIHRFDGEVLQIAVTVNVSGEFKEFLQRNPIRPGRHSAVARVALERRTIHIPDVQLDPEYTFGAKAFENTRTILAVPILKGTDLLGVMIIYHVAEVRPFTDKQIALVETFADQAAIAIENVRLFEAEQQRTRELSDSLEQQTATSEVLQVISSSPGELRPVFETMLASATRICKAEFGMLWLAEGEGFRSVALHGVPPEFASMRQGTLVPHFDSDLPFDRVVKTRQVVHVADITTEPGYIRGFKPFVELADVGGARTLLLVPMLKEQNLVGAVAIYRQQVRPFGDKQIALVANFAAQAVIAIENVRLFNELRQRTDELSRSVGELRALGEVSQAVNSTLDLETVLSTIVAKAVQLSGTEAGAIYVFDEGQREFHLRATYGMDQELIDELTHRHIGLDEPNVAEVMAKGEPIQVADLRETSGVSEINEITLRAGYHARLVAPLVRGDDVVGMLVVRRRAPGAFPQSTIDLIKTFAAQSVLAIQNARLFHEIEDKGRQLEVASRHKSQFLANMSHELRTPLNAILGYTELILDNIYGEAPDKMRSVLERVQTNGRHLLGLINDVLDLSKIEAGQLTLSLTDYSLADLVQGVYVAVEPLAAQKSLALTTNVAKGLPVGHGDERRLAQVLLNLVGNAIKFTETGEVAIEASVSDGAFRLAVRDSGPGIAAADQAKIFEEFQQVDNTSTREKGGTGLGLAISKRIVEMHGGRILVDSALGRGSTFTISLPVSAGGEGRMT